MRVLVLGAGGAASNGYARALRLADNNVHLIGTNRSKADLLLSECDDNHQVASASDGPRWRAEVFDLIAAEKIDFVHAQNDEEVELLATFRTAVHTLGAHTLLPSTRVVRLCRDKWESYLRWKAAGVPVPNTQLVRGREAIHSMTQAREADAWLRPRVGAGGQRALKTASFAHATEWIREHDGWGNFTIAEVLSPKTVTVQTLYLHGQLVCSQQRTRVTWANAGSTTTGVSGSTGIAVTSSDPIVDAVAEQAVAAVDSRPHGLYGVDMARRFNGQPCVTEINVGRFFTTAPEFYARAGFNMAWLYTRIGMDQSWGEDPLRNPLPDGKRWVRGMDHEPVLA